MSTTMIAAHDPAGGTRRLLSRNGKVATTAYIFAIVLAWCALRSSFTGEGAGDVAQNVVPVWIRASFLVALIVPAMIFLAARLPLAWLLGLSAAVGQLPNVPLFPFLHDYTHPILLLFFLSVLLSIMRIRITSRPPVYVLLFGAFLGICMLSAALNYAGHGNIWQAKVSSAFLMLFVPVGLLLFYFACERDGKNEYIDQMLDGWIWGAITQGIIAIVALPILTLSPSIAGNDTLYGLGYYYRYKATFGGPVWCAFFVISSVPLVLLWAHRIGKLHWIAAVYLQVSPWILMATASRAGRVAAIIPFLMLLRHSSTRRQMLMILPSAAIAYWLCFYYVSLPAAIEAATGVVSDPSMEMSDRYFESSERVELVKETVQSMLKAPWIVDLFGNGPGVGGYLTSGFPTAHNMIMNVWVETGALGVFLFVAFVLALLIALLRMAFSRRDHAFSAWIVTASLAGFGLANAAYQTNYWGYALVLIFIAICATRTKSTSAKL